MSDLWGMRKRLVKLARRLRRERELARLERSRSRAGGLLVEAVREASQNHLSPQERAWIEPIEALRRELNASSAMVPIVDYGVGGRHLHLPEEEGAGGQVVTVTIGDVCRRGSKRSFGALLLFKLVRKFRPSSCIELGTCLGISASFQAAALKLNGAGRLVTLEGAPALARLARQHFEAFGLDNVGVVIGRFQDTLAEVLEASQPVDYAFIDGHHDGKATVAYFEQIVPYLSEKTVLVFDDISWSGGMRRAWKRIRADRSVTEWLDLGQLGICLLEQAAAGR